MNKGPAMKKPLFALAVAALFWGELFGQDGPSQPVEYASMGMKPEIYAIQAIFDSVPLDVTKDEKLMVLVTYDGAGFYYHTKYSVRSARILAWFKYRCDDKYVTVNYFGIPDHQRFCDMIEYRTKIKMASKQPVSRWYPPQDWIDFGNLLKGVAQNKNTKNALNGEDPKQLQIPLPKHLKDDGLFDSMRKVSASLGRKWVTECGLDFYSRDANGDGDFNFWGFKSHETSFVRYTYNYFNDPVAKVIHYTIDCVKLAIQDSETPEEWKEAARNHFGPPSSKFIRKLRRLKKR